MSKDYAFSVMPSVSISRSRFARKSQHKTSFNLGQIIPIYCDEVLPGDTRSFDMASLVRMSTPIAPIMDNIYMDYYAFFVPNRLVWVHWKEFMGENNTSAGIPSSTYTIPSVGAVGSTQQINAGSYGDYMGLPIGVTSLLPGISALPFRALAAIYNRWFRNENVIAPLAIQTGDNAGVLVNDASLCYDANKILKASKLPDYFTKALPYAQKGAPVSLPLGKTAPVFANIDSGFSVNTPYVLGVDSTTAANPISLGGTTSQANVMEVANGDVDENTKITTSLLVDLSKATAATINDLRYAFQLQRFLEKDALYGTRYWEILAAHFGVQAPDASLQDPEYLGGFRQNINIDQVLSTADYANTTSQKVGAVGANSVTAGKGSLFTKSFCEHGHIIVVAVARHDQTYDQGINRMWSRKTRYDYYWPVFANLGAQAILNKEIYAQGSSVVDTDGVPFDEKPFGYQEAWAEYRYKPSIATGKLRSQTGNLNYWTLTNDFGSLPTFGQAFIEQGRDNIQRALVTSSTGPDFICDFFFQDIAVRPMPMYSIPGLIDHH